MSLSNLPTNIVNSTGGAVEAAAESVFLQRLFSALEECMRDDFQRFTFVVHRRTHGELAGRPICLDPGGPNRVLILLADECEVFPTEEFRTYRAIFRSYGFPRGGESRVHCLPVAYQNAAGLAEPVPFQERKRSCFFSGYLNSSRVDFYKQFTRVPWLPAGNTPFRKVRELARRAIARSSGGTVFDDAFPGACIRFTEAFGKGMVPDEYARTLADTKIALCPPGFVSHETIRHWEAMRLGCIVISGTLPPSRFYRGSPIIQFRDWAELNPVIHDLLAHPAEMLAIHHATTAWWRDVCSETAVASHIADVLAT